MRIAPGSGVLESAYEHCLAPELKRRKVDLDRQADLPLVYESERIEAGLRMDMVVGGLIVVDAKSVDTILPVHKAQLLTCLKLSRRRLGLLINFNTPIFKTGARRLICPN